jgi:type 1 fimbria pilin
MSIHEQSPRTPATKLARITPLLVLLLLATMPGRTWAKCFFDQGSSQGTYSVALPATIVNDPSIPLDSVLYTSYATAINHSVSVTCDSTGGNDRWGLLNNAGTTPATTSNLFPIGTTGVSYRVLQNGNYIYPYGYFNLGNNSWYEADTVTIELVKTGAIANGTSLQGSLASFKAGTPGNFIYDAVINLANRLTFTTPACQVSTASVTVTLPTVTAQAFGGVGSVAGTTSFQIGLSCSSGAIVRITLDTATPVAGKPGVIAPSSGGAGGVGVQLLDSSGVTPVQFGVAQTIGATPNGALSVNYFARYYQTGSAVSTGLLGATATFTLSYQ